MFNPYCLRGGETPLILMKVEDYIQMLVDSGVSVEDATDRAIQLGLMCCGAYCTEAGCCKFNN